MRKIPGALKYVYVYVYIYIHIYYMCCTSHVDMVQTFHMHFNLFNCSPWGRGHLFRVDRDTQDPKWNPKDGKLFKRRGQKRKFYKIRGQNKGQKRGVKK